jgi:hypothetical protein
MVVRVDQFGHEINFYLTMEHKERTHQTPMPVMEHKLGIFFHLSF